MFSVQSNMGVILAWLLISHTAISDENGAGAGGTMDEPVGKDGICSVGASGSATKDNCQNDPNEAPSEKYMKRMNVESQWLLSIDRAQDEYEQETEHADLVAGFARLIENDLKPFVKSGITKEMIESAQNRGILYRIKGHKLYRSKECNFPARCSGIQHFILAIINQLPDMEIIINVSDWPQVNTYIPNQFPVFSFSKNDQFADIMYPAWTFWEGGPAISIYPKGIGRWDLLRKKIIEASKTIPWEKKENKAFFRGSRTSDERDPLILLSREEPNLVDAQYTKNQAWKSDKDTLGMPAAQEVRFEDHCKYKYLFNYRGVAASFRYKHLFLCNSVVFQVGNQWQEFFYPLLKPWYHYIPVESNASKEGIRSLLQFAQANDDKMMRIAENGFQWVKKNLSVKAVKQYWIQLLSAYGRLIKYEISNGEGLLHISESTR